MKDFQLNLMKMMRRMYDLFLNIMFIVFFFLIELYSDDKSFKFKKNI